MTTAIDDISGLGFFYASADMARTPAYSAERVREAGGAWAAVLAESVDGRRQTVDRVAAQAEALRRVDVTPIVYTFPGPQLCASPADLRATIDRAISRAKIAQVQHLCLDFEPFDGADWTGLQIRTAIERARDAGLRVSVTVFSRPRWLRTDWQGAPLILQVYERARDQAALDRAMAQDFPGVPDVIPAIGTYSDGGVARLANDLRNVSMLALRPRGLAIWSLATTDRSERAELAKSGW